MEKVLIFGNTKEARETAKILRHRGRQVTFSVVSEYARSLLPLGTMCHVGRLDGAEMLAFIRETNPHRVIDATPPYAILASQNIRQCCDALNISYERIHFKDIEALIAAVQREKGNMLLGIGRDPVFPMPNVNDLTRMYPRIAPIPASLQACLDVGFPPENIIAIEAPFSKSLTMALFDDKKITSVVVRDATDKSYLHEMVIPALERGYHVIMYGKK